MRAGAWLPALDRVPGWVGRPRTVEPLSGGITNRNYLVTVEGTAFVVRVGGAHTDLLGIDRAVEYEANRLAAAVGVAPDVIAFLPVDGVLVTRFIHGQPVTDAAVHRDDTLSRVAESLRRVHQAGAVMASFSPFRVVEVYARIAAEHGVTIPPAFEQAHQRAKEIEAALPIDARCLCHNDLLNANFIDDGTMIRIVDWEYAAMGDRFFDLANFAVNHQLSDDEERVLLFSYFRRRTDASYSRLRLMRLMSDFREAMWGVVQQGISDLDFDFKAYAGKHFDRLLAAAADSRYPSWLREAHG